MARPPRHGKADNAWRRTGEALIGRYPRFVFGFGVGDLLPAFVCHETTFPELEPYLVYLCENNYQTLSAAEVEAVASGEMKCPDRAVALTFDGGWASLWTVVAPLLRRYNQQATAFIIPSRIQDAKECRPAWGQAGHDTDIDHSGNPFCTWYELCELSAEGRIGIQSNTFSHARIFSEDKFLRLIVPETVMPLLDWPVVSDQGQPLKVLSSTQVFHPLLPTASRMTDAVKHDVDLSVVQRIHDDPDAAPYLYKQHLVQTETGEEQQEAVRHELTASREMLTSRLGEQVHQLAFPWGVAGKTALMSLEPSGYRSCYLDGAPGVKAVSPGQNLFSLQRLPITYIKALPGRPRKPFWRIEPLH